MPPIAPGRALCIPAVDRTLPLLLQIAVANSAAERPNFVFCLADDLRCPDIGVNKPKPKPGFRQRAQGEGQVGAGKIMEPAVSLW